MIVLHSERKRASELLVPPRDLLQIDCKQVPGTFGNVLGQHSLDSH